MEAYLCYVFSDSVGEQYSAFSAGFLKVCGGEILSLFQPSELMAMVVGNNNYNWEEMEKVSVWFNHLRMYSDCSDQLSSSGSAKPLPTVCVFLFLLLSLLD